MFNSSAREDSIKNTIFELKNRRSNTKFRILEILVEMGDGWHSYLEIEQAASNRQIGLHHLFDNLIEMSRATGLIETDYKDKRSLARFMIKPSEYTVLKHALECLEQHTP
jgi:hypothetical protein